MTTVRVACCQVALDIEHAAASWRTVLDAIEAAAADGAEVIVAPELANSGYAFNQPEEVAALADPVPGPATDKLAEISARHDVVIVCGLAEVADGRFYSCAVVLDNGILVGHYRKTHLWDREHRFFSQGDRATLTVDTKVGRIATAVCYDIEFPEMVRRAAEQDAVLLLVPVNWPLLPKPPGFWPIEIVKAMAHASAYRIPIAIADRAGPERGIEWTGGSVIVDASGYPVTAVDVTRPAVGRTIGADLTLPVTRRLSAFNHALTDRRPELYQAAPQQRVGSAGTSSSERQNSGFHHL